MLQVRRMALKIGFSLALLSVCGLSGCSLLARHFIEKGALTTGPNGPDNPGTFGVPFDHVHIASGNRLVDGFLVRAPSNCVDAPAVVIYHGVKETTSMWPKAQQFLYQNCVSSLVFDYTGSGDSSRPAKFEAVGQDSIAAYAFARTKFPNTRIYVLGHSMGNGPMLAAIPGLESPPDGIIVANAFSSLRDFGKRSGVIYGLLAETAPDWWNNVKSVQKVKSPVLIIHSESDKVNPLSGAQNIYAKAPQPKQLAILQGHNHNDLYKKPTLDWWTPAFTFMKAPPQNGVWDGLLSRRGLRGGDVNEASNSKLGVDITPGANKFGISPRGGLRLRKRPRRGNRSAADKAKR